MDAHVIRSRAPRGSRREAAAIRDQAIVSSYLHDAAHVPGGHADAVVLPSTETEVAEILRTSPRVLAVGAQSSLTGGATPQGGAVLSTKRFTALSLDGPDRIRAGAGVTLSALDVALSAARRDYPPVPTFLDATVGGVVSTNAAGAATFKYGSTRPWVEALTVVLASGDVLDIERGTTHAHPDGYFDLVLEQRRVRVPVPSYRMPAVQKLSAGYFAAPGMDLIDLFIGAEGTLGVITEAVLRTLPVRPARCLAFVTFDDRADALRCVATLRDQSMATWRARELFTLENSAFPAASAFLTGLDISGIEHMDARSLALLREDGIDRRTGVTIPPRAAVGLLIAIELPAETTDADAPLAALAEVLGRFDALARTELALPGDRAGAERLLNLREAVPMAVNQRVGLAQARVDPRIQKTAGDMVVPFERIDSLLDYCEASFAEHHLDGAIWGHISDGNFHPNVIPRSFADVETGRDLMLDFGRYATRLGGAPLAEHGVGRNPTKQRLLRELYGSDGIAAMRRVKDALDPEDKLGPGNIFTRSD